MIRRAHLGGAIVLCLSLAWTGCVIKIAGGETVLDLRGESGPDRKEPKGAVPVGEDTEGLAPSSSDQDELDRALAEISSPGEAEGYEDFTLTPGAKKDIRVRDLGPNNAEGSEDDLKPLDQPTEDNDTLEVTDIREVEESPLVIAVAGPDRHLPAKVHEIDRHIEPISSNLWTEAYRRQTSPKVSPARRAGMAKVQSAITAGYGAVYVVRLEKAISLDRKNGYAYYFLARGRFEKMDWKGAKAFAYKSVQLLADDPKFRARARVLLSKSLANLGDIPRAAEQAHKATMDDPQNTEARILATRLD